jgi:hypothetical protein
VRRIDHSSSEGREFDFLWSNWNFSLAQSFRSHCGPGVNSVSNINENQEYFLWVKSAGARSCSFTTSIVVIVLEYGNTQGLSKTVQLLLYIFIGSRFTKDKVM